MCCLMSVLSSSTLEVLLDKGLDEMMMWIKGTIVAFFIPLYAQITVCNPRRKEES